MPILGVEEAVLPDELPAAHELSRETRDGLSEMTAPSPLPEAVELEEQLVCEWIDPLLDTAHSPSRASFQKATTLFGSSQPIALTLGRELTAQWATCRATGESCLYEGYQASTTALEGVSNTFVTSFERCGSCTESCEPMLSGASLEGAAPLISAGQPEGTYEVILESRARLVTGFIVDDEATAIMTSWSTACVERGDCRPRQIALDGPSEPLLFTTAEAIEIPLTAVVAFDCPETGVLTELAWHLDDSTLTPIIYAVEPEESECSCGDELACPPFGAARTLTIAAGVLEPGSYTVEHEGEVVSRFDVE